MLQLQQEKLTILASTCHNWMAETVNVAIVCHTKSAQFHSPASSVTSEIHVQWPGTGFSKAVASAKAAFCTFELHFALLSCKSSCGYFSNCKWVAAGKFWSFAIAKSANCSLKLQRVRGLHKIANCQQTWWQCLRFGQMTVRKIRKMCIQEGNTPSQGWWRTERTPWL